MIMAVVRMDSLGRIASGGELRLIQAITDGMRVGRCLSGAWEGGWSPMPIARQCPTESVEQQALMRWAAVSRGKYPELVMLYHVPNEGLRNVRTGARMRAEGLRKGVPDICLPVARGGYHGLYIELKRLHGGRVSEDQADWISMLTDQGYKACVCRGWLDAAGVIERYLDADRNL